jgi:hypothetical protein
MFTIADIGAVDILIVLAIIALLIFIVGGVSRWR